MYNLTFPPCTHRQNGDDVCRPVAQQLAQLLFGEGVGDEAEDEEGGEEEAQGSAQEGVKADALVVSHCVPACKKRTTSGLNISSSWRRQYPATGWAAAAAPAPHAPC